MTKQKRGFWLFISSLIPGAGELYMGFRKMGLSIMVLFWGCIACASLLSFDALIFLLPIIWFYSFFNVHNLKGLSEEEFHAVEDRFFLPVDSLVENKEQFLKQYHNILAIILIVLGIAGLWNSLTIWVGWFLPESMYYYIRSVGYKLPTLAVSIILIVIGIKLIKGKKAELDNEKSDAEDWSEPEWKRTTKEPASESAKPLSISKDADTDRKELENNENA